MIATKNIIRHFGIMNRCKAEAQQIIRLIDIQLQALTTIEEAARKGIDVYYLYESVERGNVELISQLLDLKNISHFKTCSELHYTQRLAKDSWVNFEMGVFYYGKRQLDLATDIEEIVKIIIQEF